MGCREFVCDNCGKTFSRSYQVPSTVVLKYCGKDCRSQAQSKPRQTRTCLQCGQVFSPSYRTAKLLQFCSRRCKSLHQRTETRKWFTRDELVEQIRAELQKAGKYLTADEVRMRIHITTRTLTRHHISISAIQREMGIERPHHVFEAEVGQVLAELYQDLRYEQSFDDCVSPRGFLLRFDFYAPQARLLVEADGTQHTDLKNPYASEYYMECDAVKTKWAADHGYLLVRVLYTKRVTRKYVLQHLKSAGVIELPVLQHGS